MRDLTDEELAKKPDSLDFYIVVGDKVYFTNVFGVDVYCAETGEFVDDSAISDLWKSAKKINQKPFDISEHEWSDGDIDNHFLTADGLRVIFSFTPENMPLDVIGLNKKDVIALAKHFKLTGEDLK